MLHSVQSPRGRLLGTRFILGLVFLASFAGAPESDVKKVPLENGQELHVKQILPSRILPHAYYNQAMASIPGVYPNSQIIAKRRIGYLGKNSAVLYSLVCYQESKDRKEVTISGIVINKERAWSFHSRLAESSFANTLVLVLEILTDLPFDKSLQP